MINLEVCCADIESVKNAKAGGADRIELCSALETGGVTPSIGLIKEGVKIFGKNVFVLIRPRTGNFEYTPSEIEVMANDIKDAKMAGAGGVVIGALTPEGEIDCETCKYLLKEAKGLSTTFHRAFDECNDPLKAIKQIQELGFDRLLTSGQENSAEEGIELIKKLSKSVKPEFIIMPGAGVNPHNIEKIITLSKCREIHGSFKKNIENGNGSLRTVTNSEQVAETKKLLSKYA